MTVRTVLSSTDPSFTWVDAVNPTREELATLVIYLWFRRRGWLRG